MPEDARVVKSISYAEELSFNKMLLFVQYIQMYCERDFDVIYLPKQGPVRGVCPAKNYQLPIRKLQESHRNAHNHKYVRREKSFDL
ncbi:hypothetical protein N7463_001618 [Penicillium fimorum]|uniref:Uncharacterized protein n=1 Tax=Penicillium fimorum TaxID=1882269 RepID=A0A9W9XXQ2_9EURO|nr:hypothetical protein N7463_001618 [Penicillium fimorum]